MNRGKEFLEAVLSFAKEKYKLINICLLVLKFNSVKYYEVLHEVLHKVMNREYSMKDYFSSGNNIISS